MVQAAQFCLSSQERSAEPFKKGCQSQNIFEIHPVETVQESTCFKASQGRAEVTVFFF